MSTNLNEQANSRASRWWIVVVLAALAAFAKAVSSTFAMGCFSGRTPCCTYQDWMSSSEAALATPSTLRAPQL